MVNKEAQLSLFVVFNILSNFDVLSRNGVPYNHGLRTYPQNLIRVMPA
jgi:hypothetical protein